MGEVSAMRVFACVDDSNAFNPMYILHIHSPRHTRDDIKHNDNECLPSIHYLPTTSS